MSGLLFEANDDRARHKVINFSAASRSAINTRRLMADLVAAFDHACDQADIEIAQGLMKTLDLVVSVRGLPGAPSKAHRAYADIMFAANQRLWDLRHPDVATASALNPADPENEHHNAR